MVHNGSDWSVVAGQDMFPYITGKGAIAITTKSLALDFAAGYGPVIKAG